MIRTAAQLIFVGMIGYAVYLSGVRLLERFEPDSSAAVSVLDPDSQLRRSTRNLASGLEASSLFMISEREQTKVLVANPLSELPFIPELVSASADQDTDRMDALTQHVLRLNSRNRVARFVEAQLAVLDGEAAQAVDSLGNLLTLNPSQSDAYLAEMSRLAGTKAGQDAILQALDARPFWTGDLVEKLASEIDDPGFLVALFERHPMGQYHYIAALARRGELERAHLTFLNFLPLELIGKTGVPFDNTFQKLPGAPPFNWRAHREYASFEPQGGLYISFFGQGRPVILSQTLRLSAGTYRAEFEMNGRIHRSGGHLLWRLNCSRSGEPLFDLPITELLSSATPFQADFEVPADDCAFQTLELLGVAGEFPRTTRALVRRADISPFRVEDAS